MDLHSATALLTGSGRGIGRAIAKEFAARGTKVALAARTGTTRTKLARNAIAIAGEGVLRTVAFPE